MIAFTFAGWLVAAVAGWRWLVERADRREAWVHVRMLTAAMEQMEARHARSVRTLRGAAGRHWRALREIEGGIGGTLPSARK